MISLGVVLTITVSPRTTIIPNRAFNRNSRNRMARQVGTEHELQEVLAAAGNRIVVVYFYETDADPNRDALKEMARSKDCGGSWHLAEICKWPNPERYPELYRSTQVLKNNHLGLLGQRPGPTLQFFQHGMKVLLK